MPVKLKKRINFVAWKLGFVSKKNYEKTTDKMNKKLQTKTIKLQKTLAEKSKLQSRLDKALDGVKENNIKVRDLKKWAQEVKKAQGSRCDCCGEIKELQAHHLWAKSKHPSLIIEVSNGVGLCHECHSKYHGYYSLKGCNPVTYASFKESINTRKVKRNKDV